MKSPIHVLRHDGPAGPFSEEQMHDHLATGKVTAADLAWREGMADWQPLSEVIALPSTPPPVPAEGNAAAAGPTRRKPRVAPEFRLAGVTELLEVFPDRLIITPRGGQGLQTKGSQGIREIFVHLLREIGFKLPGFTSGSLEYTVAAGPVGKTKSAADGNVFRFAKTDENVETVARITAFIQERMAESRVVQRSMEPASLSEELGNLARLREQGVLTEAEFLAAKTRLLA